MDGHLFRTCLLALAAAALGVDGLTTEQLGLSLAEPHLAEQDEDVATKRLGEDGVEERVGAGVERKEQHQQDLGVGHGDEWTVQHSWHGIEGNGCHAQEVGEDEHSHALGDVGVLAGRGVVGVVHGAVDLDVAGTDHQESQDVEHQHRDDVHLVHQVLGVHWQADADLLVAADAHQREQCQQQA